jgi:hypothetical protein
VSIEAGFQSDDGQRDFPGVGTLTDTHIEGNASIRHPHYQGRAACLSASTATRLLKRLPNERGRLGVLCNGGPWNLQSSWNFIARAREAGPSFVNPLQFPSTLVSATATIAAAASGAHAFAYVVGHDHFAFFEVLQRAAQAVRHGVANTVLALGICTGAMQIKEAAKRARLSMDPLDVALGFAVGSVVIPPDMYLLDARMDDRNIRDHSSAVFYEAKRDRGELSFPIRTPLVNGEALGATGAVLIAVAAGYHRTLSTSDRMRDFVVTFRDRKKFAMAAFRPTL